LETWKSCGIIIFFTSKPGKVGNLEIFVGLEKLETWSLSVEAMEMEGISPFSAGEHRGTGDVMPAAIAAPSWSKHRDVNGNIPPIMEYIMGTY